jgi:glycosyltransferase involved in cell wall biosynthesis
MKIVIIVHGRFYAFDLARELIRAGRDLCLLTNYPKNIAAKFGVHPDCVRSNLLHGIVSRGVNKLGAAIGYPVFEPLIHRWFSNWAAGVVRKNKFDIVHVFSGVAEEVFQATDPRKSIRVLVRGSSHIEEQFEILCAEEKRAGYPIDKPSDWMRRRELREYELADVVIVLSRFAYDSFVRCGVAPEKLRILPLGAQLSLFRSIADKIAERQRRIRERQRLRVITVGTFSLRKGAFDLIEIARKAQHFAEFRFIGSMDRTGARLAKKATELIEFVPKVSQFDLPKQYNWGDVFLFPTLEDGYAVVLAQAEAAGLPILTTTNCAGPEIVRNDKTGWVFPIRRPDLFVDKLRWCDQYREELAAMVENVYNAYAPRDWADVAHNFVDICISGKSEISQRQPNVARA